MLTQEKLKELLDYIPEKDIFVWKKRRYIERYAGKEAGYYDKGNRYIKIDNHVYSKNKLVVLWETGVYPNGNGVAAPKAEEVDVEEEETQPDIAPKRKGVLAFLAATEKLMTCQGTCTTAVLSYVMRQYLSSQSDLYILPTITQISEAVGFGKGSVSKTLDVLVAHGLLMRYRTNSPYVYAVRNSFFNGGL